MTDFLYRLVDRSHGVPAVAAPMIGTLFGPGPDSPRAVDTFVEHGDSERTTNGVADSSWARKGDAAFDSPLVAESEAPFQIADYAAVLRKTDRTSLADQDPTDDFESPRQKGTPPVSPTHSTAQHDQGEDIRIDEKRSTDGHEISRALTAETRGRPVDLDRTSAVSTVISTLDRKRPRQKRDQGTVTLQREAKITSPAMETTRPAGQPPAVRKSGETALLHSTPTVPLGDEVISADRVATLTVKAQRGSVEWLDSDGPAQRPQESIRPPATSVLSKDGSRAALAETLGAGEAPRPIVVSPRIASDRPSSARYATDQPSVRPAADPIASRREDADSTTPTIRVTIGRIDVRAVSPPQPPAQETAPAAPRMSLDDYLKSPNGGRR